MKELFLLGKAFNLEREKRSDGRPMWDMVIVDAPATGHGVSLLRLPQVILEVISTGPMAEEVRAMKGLLEDPSRTVINLVTLPEEMPVRETLDLQDQVDSILHIPKGYLLVNQVWPQLMHARDREILHTFRDEAQEDPRALHAMNCFDLFIRRRKLQERYLRELRKKVDMPMVRMPFLFDREFGFDQVDQLSTHIVKEAERLEMEGGKRKSRGKTRRKGAS
jgi:anion-transporting  ArsA/GET3 family ATPase